MRAARFQSRPVFLRDIRSARARILALEARLAAIAAPAAGGPVAYLERSASPDHVLVRVSADILDLIGHTPEACTASPQFWEARLHPEDRPTVQAGLAALSETGRLRLTYRFRTASQGYRRLTEELRLVGQGRFASVLGSLSAASEDGAAPAARKDAPATAPEDDRPAGAGLKLEILLDRDQIQSLMDDFQKLTGAVFAIVDPQGKVLVASGWQDICTKFHRATPDTARFCTQSDLYLTANLRRGEYVAYRCRNGLWDVVTPLYIGGKHLGNIYTGQFFYDDEAVDTEQFARQADLHGFDRQAYLEALARVPRISRERVGDLMAFLVKLALLISEMGARNLRLANTVAVSRRVAAALRDSERHFRQLATQAPIPIAIFDASGAVESFNDRFVATFGYTTQTVPSLEAFGQRAFADETARQEARQCWNKARDREAGTDIGPREQPMVCADGTPRVVEMVCSRIGEKLVAIFTDVTERKRSEQSLRASEERLSNLYSLSPVGIFLCTREGHYLSANQALADILGYDSVESLLAQVDSLPRRTFHEPAEWADIVAKLETRGKFSNRLVLRHKKDGSRIWVLMNMRAVRAADGTMSHFEGFTLDITERMAAAKALRESEERLRTLINAMPDLVCFKDGHGRWLEANAFTQKLFGLSSEQYLGRTNRELADISPLVREVRGEFATTDELAWHSGKMYRGETAILSQDGTAAVFDIIKVPLFHSDGSRRGIVVVGRDITRQREASLALAQFNRKLESLVAERTTELELKAAELEAANTRLVELDALKSAFVSSVSHEVRTPLTSILGFARLIERDFHKHYLPLGQDNPNVGAKGERILANLRVIDREGDRLKRLINDFLDLAKIEYGSLRWQNAQVSPSELIGQVADAVEGLFSERPETRLVLEVAPNLPRLWIDPDRLQQVLINLVNNAVKFTPAGKVILRASLQDARTLAIAVSDTGIGIADGELERIFEKFHQVQQSVSADDQSRGTGLGLTICRQIVQHYGGSIWAESEPGRGSTFHITLPVMDGAGEWKPPTAEEGRQT
jgi:PAS domain S-box-containing protein